MLLTYFLPLGGGRFELYAEPPEHEPSAPPEIDGRVRRWLHTAGAHWRLLVDRARSANGATGFARWRDSIVCRLADTIDDQRTLWALRSAEGATLRYPSGSDTHAVRASLDAMLRAEQRHHGRWLAVDLVLFILSGALFFVPGPNIVAYFLGFRAFGHWQSWRGARRALGDLSWTLEPSPELAELARLAELPHERRADRVSQIADRLELPHLPAFFKRGTAR